nr:glycosyltransferase [Halovulum dunhuangense]
MPATSLVIVNHSRRAELALVLKSLPFQRHPNFEVIVVSDLAPPDRPEAPGGTRWIHFPEANISTARNLGIAAAGGEIVAFCDDDAVPEFSWLERLCAPFADPSVGAAGGFVRGRNGVSFQWRGVGFDRLGRDHPLDVAQTQVFAPAPDRFVKTVGTNSAFRRAALVGIGGFDAAYRFFLDETDVNLRLSRAGWSTAIVPDAEVLHGFAESRLRTRHRVPRSLYEIGASMAHFLKLHAPKPDIAARLAGFRTEQHRRLLHHFSLGALSGRDVARLMAGLEAGLAEGASRAPRTGLPACAEAPGFAPLQRRDGGARLAIRAGLRDHAAARAAARAAAAAGHEVTLLLPEVSPRPLRVCFTRDGYFEHRFGLLGKAERDRPRPFGTVAARNTAEICRIQSLRGPLAIETPLEA